MATSMKEHFNQHLDLCRGILMQYIEDFSDEELLVRPAPGANHIAWQLGHLIGSEHQMVSAIGHAMPDLPSGFGDKYTAETSKSDNAADFHTKAEYVELLTKMREGTKRALMEMADADFSKPAPEAMQAYAANLAQVFNIIGMHDVMHGGQFVVARRKLGKPILF